VAHLIKNGTLQWLNYLIEGLSLGLFMISATVFTILFELPTGYLRHVIHSDLLRRVGIGTAMGLTAIMIIYSRFGQKSGAHMNPALTLTFYSLNKISLPNTLMYILAQFVGGAFGLGLVACLLPREISSSAVNYVVTVPGENYSISVVFFAEMALSFILMLEVLIVSNIKKISRFTGVLAGILIALFVIFEAPISGMSINPARTLASALWAHQWSAIWIYFTAPPVGMLTAGALYSRFIGYPQHAKLHHSQERLQK
jgi:aquaporin Z